MQRTCRSEPSAAAARRPRAPWPPMPASISSKTNVPASPRAPTPASASITRGELAARRGLAQRRDRQARVGGDTNSIRSAPGARSHRDAAQARPRAGLRPSRARELGGELLQLGAALSRRLRELVGRAPGLLGRGDLGGRAASRRSARPLRARAQSVAARSACASTDSIAAAVLALQPLDRRRGAPRPPRARPDRPRGPRRRRAARRRGRSSTPTAATRARRARRALDQPPRGRARPRRRRAARGAVAPPSSPPIAASAPPAAIRSDSAWRRRSRSGASSACSAGSGATSRSPRARSAAGPGRARARPRASRAARARDGARRSHGPRGSRAEALKVLRAGEAVEDLELRRGERQLAVLVLAVEGEQRASRAARRSAADAERPRRRRGCDPRRRRGGRGRSPRLGRKPLRQLGELRVVQQALGELEDALDVGLLGSGPHDPASRLAAQHEVERVGEDRLAGAGLAGDHVQPVAEAQLGALDQQQVLDPEFKEHRCACFNVGWTDPATRRSSRAHQLAGICPRSGG